MKWFKPLLNFSGLGLTEVMVTGALLGGLVLVSMHVSKMGNQGIQKVSRENSIINMHKEIVGEIGDQSSCEKSLFSAGSTIPLSSFTGSAQKDLTSINNKDGFEAFKISSTSGTMKDSVRLKRVYLTGYNSSTQMAQLKFEYAFTNTNNEVMVKTKMTNVTIVADSSKTNAQSCMLKSVASDYADYTSPTVTINRRTTQADPTSATPITFDIVFSEAINLSSFTTTDITQSGTATVTGWTLTNSGDNKSFTLTATGISVSGTVIPNLAAAKVQDLAGNDNIASTGTNKSVTFLWPAKLEWVSPTNNYSFGTQGYDSTAITFTLKNTGEMTTSSFSVITTGSFGPFNVTSNGCLSIVLGPNGQCTVNVNLLAASSGMSPQTYSGGLTTTSNSAGTPVISFSGAIAPGALAWNTTSPNPTNPHNYGSHYAASSTFTYILTNSGSGYSGTIATSQAGTTTRWEKLTDNCQGIRLAPGATCSIQMRFKGDYVNGVGSFSSSLTASSTNGGSVTYNLSGTVTYPPANLAFVTKPPEPEPYGSSYSNITRQYMVKNNSDGPSSAITIDNSQSYANAWTLGTETTACQGKSLVSQGTCTITLTFNASTLPVGSYDAKIGFSATNGGSAMIYPTGTVVSPPPPPSLLAWTKYDGASFSYGQVSIDSMMDFTLYNNGQGSNSILDVYLDGYDPSYWTIEDKCSGAILKPGTFCAVRVWFLGAKGPDTSLQKATLVAAGDDNKAFIYLDGTKVIPPKGVIAWNGSINIPVDYGTVGSNKVLQHTIINTGKGNADGITVSMGGKYPTAWSVSENCPTSLAPGATCIVTSTFLASTLAASPYTAQIQVTTTNGSGSLALDVSGTCQPTYWAQVDTLIEANPTYDFKNPPMKGARCTNSPGNYSVYQDTATGGTQHLHVKYTPKVNACMIGFNNYRNNDATSTFIRDCVNTKNIWSTRRAVASVNDGCMKTTATNFWAGVDVAGIDSCDSKSVYITISWACQ
jgi:hypothetical protein